MVQVDLHYTSTQRDHFVLMNWWRCRLVVELVARFGSGSRVRWV